MPHTSTARGSLTRRSFLAGSTAGAVAAATAFAQEKDKPRTSKGSGLFVWFFNGKPNSWAASGTHG